MADYERKRGDTYADEFQLLDSATKEPIDISSGFSFLLTLDPEKRPVDDSNNIYQLTGAVTDGPNGKFEFAPSAVQVDQLGTFYFDIQVTYPSGRIRTIESGKYKYYQDITK